MRVYVIVFAIGLLGSGVCLAAFPGHPWGATPSSWYEISSTYNPPGQIWTSYAQKCYVIKDTPDLISRAFTIQDYVTNQSTTVTNILTNSAGAVVTNTMPVTNKLVVYASRSLQTNVVSAFTTTNIQGSSVTVRPNLSGAFLSTPLTFFEGSMDLQLIVIDHDRKVSGTYHDWFDTEAVTTNAAGDIITNTPGNFPQLETGSAMVNGGIGLVTNITTNQFGVLTDADTYWTRQETVAVKWVLSTLTATGGVWNYNGEIRFGSTYWDDSLKPRVSLTRADHVTATAAYSFTVSGDIFNPTTQTSFASSNTVIATTAGTNTLPRMFSRTTGASADGGNQVPTDGDTVQIYYDQVVRFWWQNPSGSPYRWWMERIDQFANLLPEIQETRHDTTYVSGGISNEYTWTGQGSTVVEAVSAAAGNLTKAKVEDRRPSRYVSLRYAKGSLPATLWTVTKVASSSKLKTTQIGSDNSSFLINLEAADVPVTGNLEFYLRMTKITNVASHATNSHFNNNGESWGEDDKIRRAVSENPGANYYTAYTSSATIGGLSLPDWLPPNLGTNTSWTTVEGWECPGLSDAANNGGVAAQEWSFSY